MAQAGLGFNAWFNENLGLNLQTGMKMGFADKMNDHLPNFIRFSN